MKIVQRMVVLEPIPQSLKGLYKSTGNEDVEIDESDLIIFRLMGAKFEYSAVEFKELVRSSD